MDYLYFQNLETAFSKNQNNQKAVMNLCDIRIDHTLAVFHKPIRRSACLVMVMTFLLITSTFLITPYQSIEVFATTNNLQGSSISAGEKSNANEKSSTSQSAKQTEPFPDTNTCQPGQVEGPFGNCTDPVCEPGQILEAHTCVNPPCPPGMEYNEEVGECMSEDFPPDTTCPDGSKGTIRQGPNGITLIECPLPYPDSNPNPKPGVDRGNIDSNIGVAKE